MQGFVKVGYAGSHFPDHIFPSMVGRPIIRAATRIDDVEVPYLPPPTYLFHTSTIISASYEFGSVGIERLTKLSFFMSKIGIVPRYVPYIINTE